MRTTINMDEALLCQAKVLAAKTGRTLGSLIEDALRERLARQERGQQDEYVKLPRFERRPGLQPGVDLDSNERLRDLMDEQDAPV